MSGRLKKLFPLLLALTFVFGALPFGTLPVSAANFKTADALITAVNKGGSIKLTDNINMSAELVIPEGITVSLDLNGKTLNRGLTECVENGSVIRVNSGATLTVSDSTGFNSGKITGGASQNGGGICNYGTLYFDGGTIEGCKALHSEYGSGGGIYSAASGESKAALYLRGGLIRKNQARNGGGVYSGKDCTLIIEKNIIIKKVGTQAKQTITNITVTGNKAEGLGGGIYTESGMSMQDAPGIYANGSHDIYIPAGEKIKITGELTGTEKSLIKSPGKNTEITSGFSEFNTKKPSQFFASADKSAVILFSAGGEAILKSDSKTVVEVLEKKKLIKREEFENPGDAWTKAMEYAGDNNNTAFTSDEASVVEITLGSDWDINQCLYTGTKKNISVDLNGYCIKRDGKKQTDGGIFRIGENSRLTLNDSNPDSDGYGNHKGGVIANGNGKDCGGGIIIENKGRLYMYGGTLYNCVTDYHGGGIYADGNGSSVLLKNCTIDSCKTKDSRDDCHGGGIYVRKANNVNLINVTVRNCESEDKGGGLYLREKPGYVKLSNVTFEGNSANDGGGAIFIDDLNSDSEFEFIAADCTFRKNTANDRGGAVYVNDDDESDYRNPTEFLDCVFEENESAKNGSAIEVNDNGVVLSGGRITKNKTKAKGAVYVEDKYDLTVGGLLVIKDNTGKTNNQNLVLEKDDKKAYVYSAGLLEGSEIYISTSNGGTGFAGVKDISRYQSKYFHPEKGTLKYKKTGENKANMVITASLFGEGSKKAIIIMACAAVLLTGTALIVYKKRKGAVDLNDDEE